MPESNLELQRLRIKLLYSQSLFAQAVALINVGLFFYISWEVIPLSNLVIWLSFMLAIYVARTALQKWFTVNYMARGRNFDPHFWEMMFCAGTSLAAAGWMAAGTYLLPAGVVSQEAFLGFLLAGTTAGATVAYCVSLPAIFTFLIPSVVPYGVKLLISGERLQTAMAILLLLYVTVLTVMMRRLNRNVVDAINLRFENEGLLKELRETQAKATHTAKMAALGMMAGGIAHEINTPLASLKLSNDYLRLSAAKERLDQTAIIRLSNTVDATIERISKIITGLRTFAREGKQDIGEAIGVQALIAETLDFCQTRFRNHGICLTVDPIPDNLQVTCRRVQIGQVLLNLLNNAFDAVDGRPKAWVRVEVQESSDEIELAVCDSGSGIPDDLREKIMEPFFTTKDVGKGTGLGLSISLGIAESHRGRLVLDTSVSYTRFVLTLPMNVSQEKRAI